MYVIATESLNARITELDEKIDTDVSQLQDSIDAKVTQLTFETGIDIGDWESVIDPDEPVIYERYMNYHDAVAKLSQQIDIMGARTDTLKTSLNHSNIAVYNTTLNFENGSGTFDISSLGLTKKPFFFVTTNATTNNNYALISGDIQSSTNTSLKMYGFDKSGNPLNALVRLQILIVK